MSRGRRSRLLRYQNEHSRTPGAASAPSFVRYFTPDQRERDLRTPDGRRNRNRREGQGDLYRPFFVEIAESVDRSVVVGANANAALPSQVTPCISGIRGVLRADRIGHHP